MTLTMVWSSKTHVGQEPPVVSDCFAASQFRYNTVYGTLPAESVVQAGTFLYDGQVVCDLRILLSPVRGGTGDYEDPPEVSDDADQDTFYIQYGSTTSRGVFNAGGGEFSTLSAAVAHVESMPGFGSTVRWIEGAPTNDRTATGS